MLRRTNLTLLINATAARVLFVGKQAVGVEFDKDGGRQVVRARRHVVLCAGAVNSPQLLIFRASATTSSCGGNGIDTVHRSSQVGENLHDHLVAVLGFDVDANTLFAAGGPLQIVNYRLRCRGMLTSPAAEAYGFVRSPARNCRCPTSSCSSACA